MWCPAPRIKEFPALARRVQEQGKSYVALPFQCRVAVLHPPTQTSASGMAGVKQARFVPGKGKRCLRTSWRFGESVKFLDTCLFHYERGTLCKLA